MNILKIKQVVCVTEDEVRKVMSEPEKWVLMYSYAYVEREGEDEVCHSTDTRIPLTEFSGFSFGHKTKRGFAEPRIYKSFQLLGKDGRLDYEVAEKFDPTTQETARFVNVEKPNEIIIIALPEAVEYVP